MTALQERFNGALADLREIGDILAETLGYGDYAGAGDHTHVTLAIEARERVRVLEGALLRTELAAMYSDGSCSICGFRSRHEKQCPWRTLESGDKPRLIGRPLAGAETPATEVK